MADTPELASQPEEQKRGSFLDGFDPLEPILQSLTGHSSNAGCNAATKSVDAAVSDGAGSAVSEAAESVGDGAAGSVIEAATGTVVEAAGEVAKAVVGGILDGL